MEMQIESIGSFAKRIKLFSGPGTRQWPRFRIAEVSSIKGVTSDAGPGIKIINISRGGALLRTRRRLAPNKRIQVNLVLAEGVIQLTGFVLRSSPSFHDGIKRYQAAVAFDRPLRFLDGNQGPALGITPFSFLRASSCDTFSFEDMESWQTPNKERGSAAVSALFTLSICGAQDSLLGEMLKLNDW
jgi:hypothetical protein